MRVRATAIATAVLLATLGATVFLPPAVSAQASVSVAPCTCPELGAAGEAARATLSARCLAECGLKDSAAKAVLGEARPLEVIVGAVIYNVLSLVGVAFLILMIYAGIRWMTAQGAPDQVKKAQDIIKAAIIGIIIIGLAFAATAFVLSIFA
ncbi:MAG: hypothetical protein Q7S96_04930 [bacterium]|nr:hypothetical protein [bacterium]